MESSSQFVSPENKEVPVDSSLSINHLRECLMQKYLSTGTKPSSARNNVNKIIGSTFKYLNTNFRDIDKDWEYVFERKTDDGVERFLGPRAVNLIIGSESWGKLNSQTATVLRSLGAPTGLAYSGASSRESFKLLREVVVELTNDSTFLPKAPSFDIITIT